MKLNNPFVVTGYRGKEYFCDRVEETARLSLAIRNESNVTLLAPRRYGKTGLIHHLFGELSTQNGYKTIYIDIFGTKTLKDFVELLAKSIIGKLDTPLEMAQGAAKRLLQAVRPTLSYDGQTGQPTMSIALSKDAVPATLAHGHCEGRLRDGTAVRGLHREVFASSRKQCEDVVGKPDR